MRFLLRWFSRNSRKNRRNFVGASDSVCLSVTSRFAVKCKICFAKHGADLIVDIPCVTFLLAFAFLRYRDHDIKTGGKCEAWASPLVQLDQDQDVNNVINTESKKSSCFLSQLVTCHAVVLDCPYMVFVLHPVVIAAYDCSHLCQL